MILMNRSITDFTMHLIIYVSDVRAVDDIYTLAVCGSMMLMKKKQ